MEYGELEPGQEVSRHHYHLDAALVSNYVEAVQDDSGPLLDDNGRELVPAMAVAALSMRGVVVDLRIPGGDAPRRPGVRVFRRGCGWRRSGLCSYARAELGARGLALSRR